MTWVEKAVAWQRGFDAPRGNQCPYEPNTDEAYWFWSGRVEGQAKAEADARVSP